MNDFNSLCYQGICPFQVPWRLGRGPCSTIVSAYGRTPQCVEISFLKSFIIPGKDVSDDVCATLAVYVQGYDFPPLLSEGFANGSGATEELEQPHFFAARKIR
jgi:hypothetical protein